MAGPIVYFQLSLQEPETTGQWFREVFGWELTPGEGRILSHIETDDPADIPVNGAIVRAPEGRGASISLYIRTEDLDAALVRATARGATVLVPRTRTAGGADIAIIRGAEDLVLGIVQA